MNLKRALPWLLLIAVAAGLWFGVRGILAPDPAERLPDLPDLSGRPEAMVRQLRNADRGLREDPAPAYIGTMGWYYHANAFPRRAIACYEIAADLSPGEFQWRYLHALALEELGDDPTEKLREALEIEPDHALARFRLAEAAVKRGDHESAILLYDEAAEAAKGGSFSGDRPGTRTAPLSAYISFGRARLAGPTDARAALERLVAEHPGFGSAHRLLARALDELGEPEAARRERDLASRCFRFVPPADPEVDDLVRLSTNSAVLLRHLALTPVGENPDWALFLARRAVEVDPDEMDAVERLAQTVYSLGYGEEALALFRRFMPHAPDPMLIAERINECLCGLGRFEESLAWLSELAGEFPAEAFVHGLRGTTLFRMQVYDRALPELDRALAAEENFQFRTTRGACLALTGNTGEAIADFEKALEKNPGFLPALRNLVMALVDDDRFEKAEAPARRLLELEPKNPGAHYAAARIAAAAGRKGEAIRHCRAALDLAPGFKQASELLDSLR